MGVTRMNDLPGQANEYGQQGSDHVSSRTEPDNAERLTGIYESEGEQGTHATEKGRSQVHVGFDSQPAGRTDGERPSVTIAGNGYCGGRDGGPRQAHLRSPRGHGSAAGDHGGG